MLEEIVKELKEQFDRSINTASFNGKKYQNGSDAKAALIRSSKIINLLHDYIKTEFIKCGVNQSLIYPNLKRTSPELSIKGKLKSKKQDITIIPHDSFKEKLSAYDNKNDQALSINVRSQLSSLKKNIDTLYERTFAEALNLHLCYPKQCLGEVYMIPTHEYDDAAMKENKVKFKSVSKIEDYIKMFQMINNRMDPSKDEYKYERVCLLIIDFRNKPKIYNKIDELKKDELIPKNSTASLDGLTINNFAKDLLNIHTSRFGNLLVS